MNTSKKYKILSIFIIALIFGIAFYNYSTNKVIIERVKISLQLGSTHQVKILKKSGDFILVTVESEDGLGYVSIIGKNSDSNYIEIYSGQDVPLCSTMADFNVPKEIYGGCENSLGELDEN